MKKSKPTNKNKPIVIIVTFIVVALAFLLYYPTEHIQAPSETVSTKTFNSETLNVSLQIPNKSSIEELGATIDFKFDNKNSTINLVRSGNEFNDFGEYLQHMDENNQVKVIEEKRLSINGYQVARRIIKVSENENLLSYEIAAGNAIFSLSTSSPSLYSDLDQIAQSFRYTGN